MGGQDAFARSSLALKIKRPAGTIHEASGSPWRVPRRSAPLAGGKGLDRLKPMRWLAALAFTLALAVPAMDVTGPQGTFSLRDRPRGGQMGFCAEDLAAALKGSLGKDPVSHYPVLTLRGKRTLISTASALASVDGKIVRLQESPAVIEGCLWLPAEFLTSVLPQILGGPVAVRGAEAKAPLAEGKVPPKGEAKPEPKAAQAQKGASVSVGAEVAADSVRLTLAGKDAVLADVAQGSNEIVVTLAEGGLTGTVQDVGAGIVDGIAFNQGGRTLKVALGPGFKRLESLKLRDPDRLVLVFKGEGQRVNPPPPDDVQAAPGTADAGTAPGGPPRKTAAFDTVVLDPGHGGGDTGATTAGGLQEKDLTLVLAQKTAALLEKAGLRVILTRSTDTQVPLVQRTAIANYNRADLFLSIHLNSSPAPSARGTETYFLSRNATDLWSTQLAAKENTEGTASGATADSGLNLVLWELAQTSYIVESSVLAEAIQQEFNTLLGTTDRGVRQAPFVVLEGAQMPAVLVEVAFLSNPDESKRLTDPAFQDQVAQGLTQSILAFKARYDKPEAPPPAS